jgi:hypothetical protein
MTTKKDRKRLENLRGMADPARNPNEHERKVAKRKLADLQAKMAAKPKPKPKPKTRKPTAAEMAAAMETLDRRDAAIFGKRPGPGATQAERDAYWERRREKVREINRAKRAAAKARRQAEEAGDAGGDGGVNTTSGEPKAIGAGKTLEARVNTTGGHEAREKPTPHKESVNTTRTREKPKSASAEADGVNTTGGPEPKRRKPRSADRHKEPNKDRHSPGYMAAYMRAWRARQR